MLFQDSKNHFFFNNQRCLSKNLMGIQSNAEHVERG